MDVLQHTVAKYVLELAQLEYDLAHLTPSLLAASSLYLALLLLNTGNTVVTTWPFTSSKQVIELLAPRYLPYLSLLKTDKMGH